VIFSHVRFCIVVQAYETKNVSGQPVAPAVCGQYCDIIDWRNDLIVMTAIDDGNPVLLLLS
jgi:hypothetical protein